MWLKNTLVRSIGRLAVIDIRLADLFGDRREQEPREIPNPRTGLVGQANALKNGQVWFKEPSAVCMADLRDEIIHAEWCPCIG